MNLTSDQHTGLRAVQRGRVRRPHCRDAVDESRCEALFGSTLQESDAHTAEAVVDAISRTVGQVGLAGCASRMAQEFGDHPERARDRMRWARQLLWELSGSLSQGAWGPRPEDATLAERKP